MTSPNSSISSSKARRYLAALGLAIGALLLAAWLISYFGFRHGTVDFSIFELYAYQKEKILGTPSVETVFIGDSSLGNAIDAELWSALSGRTTLNLALAGGHGVGGAYNMLRQTLLTSRPATVVVMQALEVMGRDVSYRGYLATTGTELSAGDVPFSEMWGAYLNADTVIGVFRWVLNDWFGRQKRRIQNDYVAQRAPLDPATLAANAREADFSVTSIKPDMVEFLGRIADLCVREGLRCLYAHGPALEAMCEASSAYRREASARIAAVGFTVVAGTPICIPPGEAGDGTDHVRPDRKQDYTRLYFDRIAPYIEPAPRP